MAIIAKSNQDLALTTAYQEIATVPFQSRLSFVKSGTVFVKIGGVNETSEPVNATEIRMDTITAQLQNIILSPASIWAKGSVGDETYNLLAEEISNLGEA